MQVYHLKCARCGYETKLPLGYSDLDQVLTDVNLDYAEYHLFVCNAESKFVHADIHDKDFEERCPSDGIKLEHVKQEMFHLECPRCGKELATVQSDPIRNIAD